MSNPTELPDLDKLSAEALECLHTLQYLLSEPEKQLVLAELARRAQPEGEAPQADTIYQVATKQGFAWCDVDKEVYDDCPSQTNFNRRIVYTRPAATLSPLCGAQKAESGALDEEDAKLVARGMERLRKGIAGECRLPPAGWYCTRLVGHDGPCAAFPVAAQQAAAPVDCSGTPSSCPHNEGYGCHCSATGTPEAPKGYQIVPIKLPEHLVDQLASATYDLDDAAREIVREDWARALGMLRAAHLEGGKEGSAT